MVDIAKKGKVVESLFKTWLDDNQLSYLYIDQSTDTFATLFQGNIKRPDFLILLESIGLIAVDVKNKTLSGGVYTLNIETEFQKAIAFERFFRIPLWYVYKGQKDNHWYWISALKVLEVGDLRVNGDSNKSFLAIKLDQLEEIITNEDLGKLYTHRISDYSKVIAPDFTKKHNSQ